MRSSSSTPAERRRPRRLAGLLVAALAVLLGGACRVETTIGMTVDGDGSGEVVVEVTLDADAVRRVGDVAEEIRTSDLRTAGWEVDGPLAVEGGGQRLRVSHPFRTTAEAESIFRSLATEAGPFGAVEVDQRRGFWSTTTDFEATVDLAGGLEALGDAELSEALGGQRLGVTAADLERRLGDALDRIFDLQVAVRLPGDVHSNAPQQFDGGARWSPRLGDTVTLRASSTAVNRPRIALAVIAFTSAAAAIGLGGGWAIARRRGHHLPEALRPSDPDERP